MEACGGSHFLGKALQEQGHEVRLIPPQYVKPFVKTNKNDYVDAEAIAEAVDRPTMRFVPIKSDDQLDMQSLHRVLGDAPNGGNQSDSWLVARTGHNDTEREWSRRPQFGNPGKSPYPPSHRREAVTL
jgi:hypothetical protein